MARVSASDFSAILRFVHQLQLAQDLESFSTQVVRGLRGLIGSELASYSDVDVSAHRIFWVSDPAEYRQAEAEYQVGTMFPGHGTAAVGIALNRRRRDFGERDRTMLTLLRPHLVEGYRSAFRFTELQGDLAAITSGVDLRVGLVVLGEDGEVRLATTRARHLLSAHFDDGPRGRDTLPSALDAWVRHHETAARDYEVPAPRTPYVVERYDRRVIVRLIGEQPRRLLLFSEERLGVDRQALEALGLTRREAEVLRWLAEGKRDREIALILGISPRTVQHHLERVYDKLGVETRNAAVAVALRASADPPPV